VLILAAHLFPAPFWWQAICDTITAFLIALLFCSYGFGAALVAVLAKRPDRWFEHVGQIVSIFGGVAFAALGLLGVWIFFKSAVLGL
jgi:hypothetical protein